MKYKVKFQLDKPEFRSDYRRTVISFFKKAISDYMDGMFYTDIYENGAHKKSFVWSVRFPNPKFHKEKISLESNEIEMTLKFADAETALIYYSGLLEMKNKRFPVGNENFMILEKMQMVRENVINGGYAIFKVLSPICLKQHLKENQKDWYINVEDSGFETELQRKLMEDMPELTKEIENMVFHFDGLKKVIIPAYGIKFPATIGIFTAEGNDKILNHMLQHGVGSKRNSGFGLIEQIQ